MAEQPSISPFEYLYIPSDDKSAVRTVSFSGNSDDELRTTITAHFKQNQLTRAQRQEMTSHVLQKAEEQQKKNARVEEVSEEEETAATNAPPTTSTLNMAEDFVDHSTFEIIPVVMPTRATGFIGTSLYIDDAGRFKDLPLNSRASRIAQRDIRGDAFLLSNHDDPAQDVWARVDCPMSRYESLLANPQGTTYDSSNAAQMAAESARREQESKKISLEDAAAGLQAKADGNKLFQEGDVLAAVQAYSTAIELLAGRRDLHSNAEELDRTVEQSYLNRSMCYGKLLKWGDSARDAEMAVGLNPGNGKGYFRLATARCQQQDFKAALDAVAACEMTFGGSTEDTRRLREEIAAKSAEVLRKQKASFGKMFQ